MSCSTQISRRRTESDRRFFRRRAGLQTRMALSYLWVTVVLVVLLEMMGLVLLAVAVYTNIASPVETLLARQTAEKYALLAAVQGRGMALDPHATFLPGRPGSLMLPGESDKLGWEDLQVPYTSANSPPPDAFALLIAPGGAVVASSYPQRYPGNRSAAALLPSRGNLIAGALRGVSTSGSDQLNGIAIVYAVEPVWSWEHRPIGAVYVQLAPAWQNALALWKPLLLLVLVSGVLLLVLLAPIGGLFGLLTTRGLVRRIRHLAAATTQFASGDYGQRVPVSRADEIGQLERHFNQMAEQLTESIAERQRLAGDNARLAERARISRELHDAISQDLFSLRMLVDGLQQALPEDSAFQSAITTLGQTALNMTRQMRALLLELRPLELEHLGLAAALKELAATYSTRLGITVTADIASVTLPPQAEHALLRVAQEALTNAARHAHARRITLRLALEQQGVVLTIADDGKGFQADAEESQHGFGLHSLRERVEALDGTLLLETAPGQGTRLHIWLPQEEAEHEGAHC
jgi:signal transduction histidine kinase